MTALKQKKANASQQAFNDMSTSGIRIERKYLQMNPRKLMELFDTVKIVLIQI